MRTSAQERSEMIADLIRLGVSYQDAEKLRRISKTLNRWFEMECGTENATGASISIERDEESSYLCTQCYHKGFGEQAATCNCEKCGDPAPLRHIGSGKPFQRIQYATQNGYVDRKYPIADREAGARKRLAQIMTPYKRKLVPYIQGDCRGASLYILRKSDVRGQDINSIYTRGVAIY